MKLSVCTITFRHHLLCFSEIVEWTQRNGFDGVELWGAHARGLMRTHPEYDADWLRSYGLSVPMLSDYLPTDGDITDTRHRAIELCRIAQHWSARKIRTFAGNRPSAQLSREQRRALAGRIGEIAGIVHDHGIRLLVETHPNTLADNVDSTLGLLADANHPGLGINFDALHVWEGGDDPVLARRTLADFIGHYHLKNVRSRDELGVFAPENVYSAAGSRDGMVPLFDGAMDYEGFLASLADETDAEASLEWFGHDCFETLARDRLAIFARSISTRGRRGSAGTQQARLAESRAAGRAASSKGPSCI
ncbi:3-dehydroshikimate dehydratase [Rhodopseudomonas palustris]|uniref:Sugar phosphate isomerase/epimerase n=2 Tax=Rhodopseudomonas palustris TaxID=1076 RepID=Q6N774_RHOPA|nr:sugar phosphate isomerase/epimerase [Rhodopseudomonas palustris]OPF90355.1 3-dehydroshikimate dehydratase [Rhodopseudomonas palustris]QQM03904.1 3-dehydroshikimate dehydratase [Rhodopseudomonas palustris]WAB80039.1 sugar phosphate isomerase/epimerase [Rhodopseudomonas palustris]WCL92545.1 sugar phosphate isomerase/epimerase [Rhodopseudomonas palustris CGA009]WND53929.1 sugar phosphate isomerase/epimerase [Rhodopseudomonas palustris]